MTYEEIAALRPRNDFVGLPRPNKSGLAMTRGKGLAMTWEATVPAGDLTRSVVYDSLEPQSPQMIYPDSG